MAKSASTIRISDTLRQFLLPEISRVLLYLLIGSLLLIVLNIRSIWQWFKVSILSQPGGLGDIVSNQGSVLDQIFSHLTHGRVLQFIFWAWIGCITYIFVWFLKSMLTNIRNDIVADEYLHPASYSRTKYWQNIISRKLFFVISLLGVGTFAYANLVIQPLLAEVLHQAVTQFKPLASPAQILLSIVCSAFLIHIFVLIVHLSTNYWRFIYKDL